MADTDKIAGYFDIYWMEHGVSSSAAILGNTGPDGINWEEEFNLQEITGDAYGPRTVVDWIYQGGNMFLNFVIQDVKLISVKKFLNPWTFSTGTPTYGEGRMATPGALGSNTAIGTLQLIPRSGTPAASYMASGGSGMQFKGLCIGPHNRSLDTRARFVPVRFQCVPYDIGSGTIGWMKPISAAS